MKLAGIRSAKPPNDALRSRIILEVCDTTDHKLSFHEILAASKLMLTPWLREDQDLKTAVLKATVESAIETMREASFPLAQITVVHHAIHGLDHLPTKLLEALVKHPLLFDEKGTMRTGFMHDNRPERIEAKWKMIQIVGNARMKLEDSNPHRWPQLRPMLPTANLPSIDNSPGEWNARMRRIKDRIMHHLGGGEEEDDSLIHEGFVLPHYAVVTYVFAVDSDGRPVPVPDSLCSLEHMALRRPASDDGLRYYAISVCDGWMHRNREFRIDCMRTSFHAQMKMLGYTDSFMIDEKTFVGDNASVDAALHQGIMDKALCEKRTSC